MTVETVVCTQWHSFLDTISFRCRQAVGLGKDFVSNLDPCLKKNLNASKPSRHAIKVQVGTVAAVGLSSGLSP